ncbi:hypothetical protein [Agromyces albus]|uniref:hypothetical protein n=1 Tax=Agromyces albus TaxID=205332 RepID=UPI002786BB9E|nr:hypothetical protein [Agromyces albus]MDQ0575900.1 hypothetical protein [Agromyces albus]
MTSCTADFPTAARWRRIHVTRAARAALEGYLEGACESMLGSEEALFVALERDLEPGAAVCRVASSCYLRPILAGFLVPAHLGDRIGAARDRIRFADRVLDRAPRGDDIYTDMKMFGDYLRSKRRAEAYIVFLSSRASEPWERALAVTSRGL